MMCKLKLPWSINLICHDELIKIAMIHEVNLSWLITINCHGQLIKFAMKSSWSTMVALNLEEKKRRNISWQL